LLFNDDQNLHFPKVFDKIAQLIAQTCSRQLILLGDIFQNKITTTHKIEFETQIVTRFASFGLPVIYIGGNFNLWSLSFRESR
jgi:UDP-2,3-diacylglucosamine pyrophosphatase LpxH